MIIIYTVVVKVFPIVNLCGVGRQGGGKGREKEGHLSKGESKTACKHTDRQKEHDSWGSEFSYLLSVNKFRRKLEGKQICSCLS